MVIFLCPSLLAAARPPQVSARNPSCEEESPEGVPVGWVYAYSSNGACDLLVDRQVKHTGEGSIRLENHPGGARYPRMIQALELSAHTSFLLTAWVRCTSGRSTLQVTPGGTAWFGKKDYGPWVNLPADGQWRRVQKRFATGDEPTCVNIVFTLLTPKREAASLWVDDIRLVTEDPAEAKRRRKAGNPDLSRFIPPVDTGLALPRVDWAEDLPGPRRRVLFMAPAITIRDVVELAGRLDVDAEVHYQTADLAKLLSEPWDAVVLASVDWECFSVAAREALWAKVRGGTGLLVVKPGNGDDELARVIRTLRPKKARVFFAHEPQIELPCLEWLRGGAGLLVGSVGKGRMAVIDYDLGRDEDWGERVCSLFPPFRGRVPRADEMPWWEPVYAMYSRVVLWSAGALQPEIIDLAASKVGRDHVTLTVHIDKPGSEASVRAVCVGPGNRCVAEKTAAFARNAGKGSLVLRAPFRTGRHFVWVWVLDRNVRSRAWAALLFTVPGPTVEVTPERERYERGESLAGTVTVRDVDTAGARLDVSLVDGFERVVDRTVVDAADRVPFALSTGDVRSLTARVVARLVGNADNGERVECESFRVVPVARDLDDKDYLVGIWASYYQLACRRPWSHHLVRFQREMGVDFGLMAHSGAEIYHQTYAEHDMVPVSESMHRIYFKLSEQFEKMNLADPAFEPRFRQAVRRRAGVGYRWGAHDFSVGDECGYTLRYDKHTLDLFRQGLVKRHGDIASLNRHWGTDLQNWDEVTAELLKTRDPLISIAPWLTFRLFSDQLFVRYFRIAREEVCELDAGNRCGLSGTRDPGHYIGFDWHELMKTVTHLAFYDGIQRECIRSFRKPGDVITSFVGYDFHDLDERNARYFPWLELFNGFQGISIYSASSSTWHGYIRHDLSWTKRAAWTMEELRQLKTGVGRAILTATREPAPIAVLYSQRSLHAAGRSRWVANVTGVCEVIKDLGLQFEFVADEQVANGMLRDAAYKVLFLPLAVALSEEEVKAIREFATRGGRVVAVGETGVFNRFGRTREQGALDSFFGIVTPTTKPPAAAPPAEATARLFGVELTVTPCGVMIPRGIGEYQGVELCPCSRRSVGRGEAVFVNFLWGGYRSFRSGGVGGEITQRISADARTAGGYWRVMEALLAGLGIEPPAAIACGGRPVRYIEQVLYRRGPITYFGILPRYFGGRYPPALQQVRAGQRPERVLIRPEDFTTVEILLREKGSLYDVRARKPLGAVSPHEARITDGVALLYAVTPYEVMDLALSAPAAAHPGDTLDVELTVEVSSRVAGDHVVHVRLIDPDGVSCRWATANVLACRGRAEWHPRLALNASAGTWRIEAEELISGHTASAEIRVGGN